MHEAQQKAARGRPPQKSEECEARFREILADGKRVPSAEVKQTLKAAGYGTSTIGDVKRALEVKDVRVGRNTEWYLPIATEVGNEICKNPYISRGFW